MKIIFLTIFLALSAYAGGIWSMLKNAGLTQVQSQAFVIEVEGVDIRGYTFKPVGVDMVCVSVWGGKSSSHQLECKSFKELGLVSSKPVKEK